MPTPKCESEASFKINVEMTSIVGIRCRDGVVIGADSSATFGSFGLRTMEQQTLKKIEIIGNSNRLIIAGTGSVGFHQRYVEAVREAHAKQLLKARTEVEVGKQLALAGVSDFASTTPANQNSAFGYSALVAFRVDQRPSLCELDGSQGFQPEIKKLDDFWFASAGSGQNLTDPFLALFRQVFWSGGSPDLKGGIFTAYWAIKHACDLNPGGINYPIRMAVLAKRDGALDAWMLSEDDLAETDDMVRSATEHFGKFKDIVLGNTTPATASMPPAPPSGA